MAQLDGMTITDAIRAAIEGWIETKRSQGDLATRAAVALEEIERDAEARRAAIQSLLTEPADNTTTDESAKGRSRGRRGEVSE